MKDWSVFVLGVDYGFFSGGFDRENFLKTCKSRNLISIDQAGFDIWKNMSKEVKFFKFLT